MSDEIDPFSVLKAEVQAEYKTTLGSVYFDHAGATIPSSKLLQEVFEELQQISLGNPHSNGKFSSDSDTIIREARQMVLSHFNTTENEYEVIFTSGATAGIKLVGECLPWSHDSCMCYPFNSHTSLLGLRSYAPNSVCIPSDSFHSNLSSKPINTTSSDASSVTQGYNLLAVPGECNFSGAKSDISCSQDSGIHQFLTNIGTDWLSSIQGVSPVKSSVLSTDSSQCSDSVEASPEYKSDHCVNGVPSNNYPWLWLLDAAKLAATSTIDLQSFHNSAVVTDANSNNTDDTSVQQTINYAPHFVCISFYKIFGYPTGLGALLVRRDTLPLLRKRYYGGGTLLAATADTMFQIPKQVHSYAVFEDGTPNFYGIAAIRHGFAFIKRMGGIKMIQTYLNYLTRYLVARMKALQHHNSSDSDNSDGHSLCTIFGRHFEADIVDYSTIQGPVITFTLQYANGEPIGFAEVERLANENGIQLRTGCFCNVGGCQEALQISAEDTMNNYAIGRVCSDSGHDVVNGRHTGAVRVSLGISNTIQDCDAFLAFLTTHFLNKNPSFNTPQVGSLEKTQLIKKVVNGIEDICLYTSQIQTNTSSVNHVSTVCDTVEDSSNGGGKVKIAAMFVYPIKSCAGIRVTSWPLSSTGFLYDRHWALVDSTGKALTQKMYPRLALVQPSIDLEKKLLIVSAQCMREVLVVNIDDDVTHETSSSPTSDTTSMSNICTNVNICGQLRRGAQISSNADKWFSTFLSGGDSNLAECNNYRKLECSFVKCIQEKSSSGGNEVSFANSAQFLMLSAESVRALIDMITDSSTTSSNNENTDDNIQKSELNIKVENFRPNILVSYSVSTVTSDGVEGLVVNGGPHQEDNWSSITVPIFANNGDHKSQSNQQSVEQSDYTNTTHKSLSHQKLLTLKLTGPCSRCSMVNVNGKSGVMDCRAFQALAGYRKKGGNVYFGQFLTYDSISNCTSVREEATDNKCVGNMLDNGNYYLNVDSVVIVINSV